MLLNITGGDDFSQRNEIKPTKNNDTYFYNDQMIFSLRKTEKFFIAFADERKIMPAAKRFRFQPLTIEVKVVNGQS